MLMMTGYLFRNAEYVLTLQQLLNIKSRSLDEYKRVFDAIDTDNSGYIEVGEVEQLLRSFYGGETPPTFEVDAFVRFFDRGKKGRISWKDFKNGFGLAAAVGGAAMGPDPRQLLEAATAASQTPVLTDGSEDQVGEAVAGVEGKIVVELEGGSVEVDAVQYLDGLRAEAEALREVRLAKDPTWSR